MKELRPHLGGKEALIPLHGSGETYMPIYVAYGTRHSFKIEIPQICKSKYHENLWILQRPDYGSKRSLSVQGTFKCLKLQLFEHKSSPL